MSLRNRIAHAATPWDWRSRRRVELLVGLAVLWGIGALVAAVVQRESNTTAGFFLNLAIQGAIWYLVPMSASIRSVRRWDSAHRAPVPA